MYNVKFIFITHVWSKIKVAFILRLVSGTAITIHSLCDKVSFINFLSTLIKYIENFLSHNFSLRVNILIQINIVMSSSAAATWTIISLHYLIIFIFKHNSRCASAIGTFYRTNFLSICSI